MPGPEPRKSTFVPVTTMEEVPILSDEERRELIASLEEARAEVAAGKYTERSEEEFRTWLSQKVRAARQRKAHGA